MPRRRLVVAEVVFAIDRLPKLRDRRLIFTSTRRQFARQHVNRNLQQVSRFVNVPNGHAIQGRIRDDRFQLPQFCCGLLWLILCNKRPAFDVVPHPDRIARIGIGGERGENLVPQAKLDEGVKRDRRIVLQGAAREGCFLASDQRKCNDAIGMYKY